MKILKQIILIFLILAGMGFTKKISGKKLENIDIVLDWYPNAIHGFIYTAMEKGYFEDEGIKVNIRFPATPNDPIALTAAGRADIGIFYMHQVIMRKTDMEIPVKSIGALVKKPVSVIISPKEKNILSPKDLEGKKIGYSGSSYNEAVIKSLLKSNGKSPDSAKMMDVGFELLTSMITNQVDATIGGVVNHEIPVMEEKGIDINYFTPEEYGLPDHYGFIFVAGEETISKRGEVLKKFLRAAHRGLEDVKKDPEVSVELVLKNQQKENFTLSRTVENRSINILLDMMKYENGSFFSQDKEIWEKNIDWLYEEKLIDKKLPAESFYSDYNDI